jgi:ABC-type multidrug transport system ATPase subunit
MNCIETKNLSHHFSDGNMVLNNINLQIPSGSIYGFLGPNGAGKTTTLKLILGLLKKQKGSITVFGKAFETNRIEILRNVGSLIESPSLYGHLTAAENLEVLQRVYQSPKKRIFEVLEIVGLEDTKNKKTSQFSLGMKQRLSIAMSLLHSPSLLILDEPTNGLDPNGIIEMRELLRRLNSVLGMTIVISSHLLSEIEKIVTHVGILHKSSLMFQGTLSDLQFQQKLGAKTSFVTNDLEKTLNIINSNGYSAKLIDEQITLQETDSKIISELNETLVNNRIKVFQINTIKNDLESIFIDLVNN